jgi:phosphoribosyl-ATP pyrophosphohydrolase/phosphoribosyl-AMP cyclohydrolase/histidinol dehydrogenase
MPGMLECLEEILRERKATRPHGSYSAELFADPELLQRKIMEEAFEVCLELGRQPLAADRAISEAADLVFHLTAGLVAVGLEWNGVFDELERRAR